jgi:uncharacterized protein YjbI with pentapeptide repeats
VTDFVCEVDARYRSACDGLPFYAEHEGKRFCVLHFPSREKQTDTQYLKVLERKYEDQDFDFAGVYFPSVPNSFVNFVFKEDTSFFGATFGEAVDFSVATFTKKVAFSGATFNEAADFSGATFNMNAHFSGATFSEAANFSGATFTKEAYFSGAIFSTWAHFFSAAFSEWAEFRGAIFTKEVTFAASTFSGVADFTDVTFNKAADFSKATFSKAAYFVSDNFSGAANFSHATFSEVAHFPVATFSKRADFGGATFNEEGNFSSATFNDVANFSGVFLSEANFSRATFSEAANFPDAIFSKQADFRGATFKESAVFRGSGTLPQTLFAFWNVTSEKPERISFHTTHLRPCFFIDVDTQKFDFSDVEWFKLPSGDKVSLEEEIRVLENSDIERLQSLRKLTKACTKLMKNAEDNDEYPLANEFHFWSMDAGRKADWGFFKNLAGRDLLNRETWLSMVRHFGLITFLYWALSGYGERAARAFWVLVGICAAFAALYMVFGPPKLQHLGQAVVYSLGAVARLNPEPRPTAPGLFQLLVIVEGLLGPLQIALLALAIRRKVMR